MQTNLSLFENTDNAKISGLSYIPNYITPAQETELIKIIDNQPWINDLKRRVQHYGYKYDYRARSIDNSMKLDNLPEWVYKYAEELFKKGHFPQIAEQVIINEYQPGQGIARHIDCIPCFGGAIASLSIGSPCVMDFFKENEKISLLLEPRSLLILSGDARYKWQHSIAARKTDKIEGDIFKRKRRISLTFRSVL